MSEQNTNEASDRSALLKELSESIGGMIHVGWRKGVDGEGSSQIWKVLGNCFDCTDPAIKQIAHEHVEALGLAAAKVIIAEVGDDYEGLVEESLKNVAAALKEAAIIERPVQGTGSQVIAPDVQGIKCFDKLLPFEHQNYGRNWRFRKKSKVSDNKPTDTDLFQTYVLEIERDTGKWEHVKTLFPGDEAIRIACLAVLAMVDKFPAVHDFMSDELVSMEGVIRQQLTDAAKAVTDDGWLQMAYFIQYSLNS